MMKDITVNEYFKNAGVTFEAKLPKGAKSVSDPSKIPKGWGTFRGPRGGLYAVPPAKGAKPKKQKKMKPKSSPGDNVLDPYDPFAKKQISKLDVDNIINDGEAWGSVKSYLIGKKYFDKEDVKFIEGDGDAMEAMVQVAVDKGWEGVKEEPEELSEVEQNVEVKSLLNALQSLDTKYKDINKVSVHSTPKGNWKLFYEGKAIGSTLKGSELSEDTVRKYGLEHHFKDEEKPEEPKESQKPFKQVVIIDMNTEKILDLLDNLKGPTTLIDEEVAYHILPEEGIVISDSVTGTNSPEIRRRTIDDLKNELRGYADEEKGKDKRIENEIKEYEDNYPEVSRIINDVLKKKDIDYVSDLPLQSQKSLLHDIKRIVGRTNKR